MIDFNENIDIIQKKVENGHLLGRVCPRNQFFIKQLEDKTEFLDIIYKDRIIKIRPVDRLYCIFNDIKSSDQVPIYKQCKKKHRVFLRDGVLGFSKFCGVKCSSLWMVEKNKDPEIIKKASIARKKTFQKRYGVDHISQLDDIKKQKKKTAIDNYGSLKAAYYDTSIETIKKIYNTDNISNLDFIKEKKKETSRQNYGTDYPWQSDKGKQEQKQGILDKYNTDNVSKLDFVKEKKKETFILHYNETNIFKTVEFIVSNSGKNNPNWKGGVQNDPYCEMWTIKEFKQMILDRDLNKCLNPACKKNCNVMSIHHIDYNKINCSPSNLITLCTSCNSTANYNRQWHESWYIAIILKRYGPRGI